MMRAIQCAVVVGLVFLAGCDILALNMVHVSLVNSSDYDVEVELYISDQQELPEVLLTELGDELQYTISAGQTVSFSRDCDELQAIMIEDADLQVIGGIGPEASTGVLRDGDDFNCGSFITFTFDHSDEILDFDITVRTIP
ncbi:MAG: hypothetical protein JSU63_18935 [Phycisphaerales bacterium]|nr:MAG: hypothetical protein JSU63_18935 [Phycisphaerales bacterium]